MPVDDHADLRGGSTMKRFCVKVELTVRGPLMSRALGATALGLDMKMHRSHDHTPALPETLILGRLAQGWIDFFDGMTPKDLEGSRLPALPALLCSWFLLQGKKLPTRKDASTPFWGQLAWKDCLGEHTPAVAGRRPFWPSPDWRCTSAKGESSDPLNRLYRVKLDSTIHAAEDRMLVVIEAPFPAGAEIDVEGDLYFLASDEEEAKAFAFWVGQGFAACRALGAMESEGFGKVLNIQTSLSEGWRSQAASRTPEASISSTFTVVLNPDRPICFPPPVRPSDNRHVSRDFIPGAALKAVLADQIRQAQDIPKTETAFWAAFDALRVRHALPVPKSGLGHRPLVPPLSWVFLKDRDDPLDLALLKDPEQLPTPPLIQGDWKHEQLDKALLRCGRLYLDDKKVKGWLERSLQAHPGIDPERQTVADKAFHTLESVDPWDHEWITEFHLPSLDLNDRPIEKATQERLLAMLQAAFEKKLGPIGRTDAFVEACMKAGSVTRSNIPEKLPPDGKVVVVLQSEALLLTEPWELPPTGGEAAYAKALEAAWDDLSHGSLKLLPKHHFSALRGVGGEWRHGQSGQKVYQPVLLSTEGSTFVLEPVKGREADARARIKAWAEEGLPQRSNAPGGNDWSKNPFLAANGFGEVTVNLAFHEELSHA